ncbi:GH92 family glycosyl hydrolase [Tamlana crocina]|uniref:Glycoside hydrolase family 92 protein n=1 Tax=Tamlana crocina TaxID=393006 RepID=A0ABX1DDQ9_9FLAO|nr:GH92 family glycosyl hydrolase [Tamlana crocina]NJX14431.1 glycoside hydrolase family 92 protein [Tamlana crocina]
MKNFKFGILFFVLMVWSGQSLYAKSLSIASKAKVNASSSLNKKNNSSKINDGIIAIKNQGNWMAKSKKAWVELAWEHTQIINKVVLYNHPDQTARVIKGKLLFSDGTTINVDLPSDGSAIAVEFDEKSTQTVRFIIEESVGEKSGLSEIEVYASPNQYTTPVEWVDPYIETNRGRFFLFATGSRPYGVISAAPMTINWNNGGGGYAHKSDSILGFPQIHAWTLSGLNLMPTLASVNPTKGEQFWKSSFKHDDEIVQPGYHRVFLPDSKVWVEQTSTDRVSFYRFKWTEDVESQLLLSLGGLLGNSRMTNADVTKINKKEFEGSISSVDRAYNVGPKDVKIYFVVQVDEKWKSFDGWNEDENYTDISSLKGDNGGVSMKYKSKAGDEVQLKIAISYTSIENARNNLKTECTTWDFDTVAQDSRNQWNDWMSNIKVEGGTVAQRIKFYTDLWHVLLGRHRINDVNGDYPDRTTGKKENTGNLTDGFITDANFKVKNPGVDASGKVIHNMYNSDAFWLTQWNLNVLWGLAWPEIQDDMASSMVAYSNNGGLLPRGPSGGGYSFIMTGCPSTNLIVSAYMKDILTKTDPENAFEQIKQNHMPGGMMGGGEFFKHDLEFYVENGWWPNNAGINIEAAFQDWGAAQMAYRLGKTEDYNYFIKRSESWKKCFNEEHKLLFPVDHKGNFTHNDPLRGWGYVEANAWQATWGVSHDIPGLAQLMGGNEVLWDKLNFAFDKGKDSDFVYSYSKGYVSYANQPGCSNAHVFSYANAPWLTQYWVRQVNEKAYGGITPDLGWGGHDEDQGQMGGVSALMSIGLFNIIGTESQKPFYEITAPVFDKVTIKLDNKYYEGKEFVIKTYNNSAENCYIQKAKLNGKELNNFWFYHDDFAAGGELEIWLGNKPNKKWGLQTPPPVNINK